MKVLSFLAILLFCFSINAQNKFTTQESVMNSLYASISGGNGQNRDWTTLFMKDAKIVLMNKNQTTNEMETKSLSVEEYIKSLETDFSIALYSYWAKEISIKTQDFGNITQILSEFAVRENKDYKAVYLYGLNSIQLRFDGKRFWILSMYQQTKGACKQRYYGFREYDEKTPLDVTNLILSRNQIDLVCSKEKTINVETKVKNEAGDILIYDYIISGGKI
ncbi:MAG: hypothetical protein MUC29_13010, partial [Pyrinomonadaceae bacterium]|nr:hypothetical protein [Pyrinomonadaceae bacterium]